MNVLSRDIVLNFMREIRSETDRGTAIVGASVLDDLLAEILRKRFVNLPKIADLLLVSHGPRGSVSSRIHLVHMLGISRPDQYHDLNIVRKIRNRFAHVHQPVSFDDQSISDLCNNFRQVEMLEEYKEEMPEAIRQLVTFKYESTRELFIAHVVQLFAGLVLKMQSLSHIEENSVIVKENSGGII